MEDILKNNTNTSNPVTQPTNPSEQVPVANPNQLAGDQYQKEETNPEDLDSRWLRWKCLNCGYVYEGIKELKKCYRCGNENPDLFGDAD